MTKIICFGEVLWDMLPSGKMAGGAPMNVAFHLNNFNISSAIISRVGADELGEKIFNFLQEKGVDTTFVQQDVFYPTGTVAVTLDEKGSPSYEIVQPVAWDFINVDVDNSKAIRAANALVYGSLAARSDRTKETLLNLLELAKQKIFDVNLRTPFYNQAILETLLTQANIVKMNDEELELIGGWYFDEEETDLAKKVKNKFNLDLLIVTQGSKGAFLINAQDEVVSVLAQKIVVKDTIGSGDAFLAAFLSYYFKGESLEKCLDFAAKTGALVATKQGGTPKINEAMVIALGTRNK